VDDAPAVRGFGRGRFEGLDLATPLYIGGVPKDVDASTLSEWTNGFVGMPSETCHSPHDPRAFPVLGCVSRLVVNGRSLLPLSPATVSVGVTGCESCAAAATQACANGGVCIENNVPQGHTCICPPGYSGEACKKKGEQCYAGTV
jgi:hypothetical protein